MLRRAVAQLSLRAGRVLRGEPLRPACRASRPRCSARPARMSCRRREGESGFPAETHSCVGTRRGVTPGGSHPPDADLSADTIKATPPQPLDLGIRPSIVAHRHLDGAPCAKAATFVRYFRYVEQSRRRNDARKRSGFAFRSRDPEGRDGQAAAPRSPSREVARCARRVWECRCRSGRCSRCCLPR